MRKTTQLKLIELIDTVKDCVKQANKGKGGQKSELSLNDAYAGISVVGEHLNQLSPERACEYDVLISEIIKKIEKFQEMRQNGETGIEVKNLSLALETSLEELKKELQSEPEVKITIVFLPYKLSMWDSFESIWREAMEDPRCQCYVVPIPYYERGKNMELKTFFYEGDRYPDEVMAIDYKSYQIEAHHPDIIYYHNPYDENNYVTSVHPDYYSNRLKNYTDLLVYVPYAITRTSSVNSEANIYDHVARNADYIICQNEKEKKCRCRVKSQENQFLSLGNPKLDLPFYLEEHPPTMPEGWAEKIKGRKVILLNLSIDYVLRFNMEYIYMVADLILKGEFRIVIDGKLIEPITTEKMVLLFRPHPLLESTFRSMRPTQYEAYLSFLEKIENAENVIIDTEEKIDASLYYSDALMTTNSSLICNYIATKKPVFIMLYNLYEYNPHTQSYNENRIHFFDFSQCFFPAIESVLIDPEIAYRLPNKQGRLSYETSKPYHLLENLSVEEVKYGMMTVLPREFLRFVHNGFDNAVSPSTGMRNTDFRFKIFADSAEHCDGNNGKNIYHEIKKRLFAKNKWEESP